MARGGRERTAPHRYYHVCVDGVRARGLAATSVFRGYAGLRVD